MFYQAFFEKQRVPDTESLYSGTHSLVGVGWKVGGTPTDRLLTCKYGDGSLNNPLHFSNPT